MQDVLRDLEFQVDNAWPAVAILNVLIALVASGHAVLFKRDIRATISWVGFIWLVPLLGAGLYALLGVNRIGRRVRSLRADQPPVALPQAGPNDAVADVSASLAPGAAHLAALARVVAEVTCRPMDHLTLLIVEAIEAVDARRAATHHELPMA